MTCQQAAEYLYRAIRVPAPEGAQNQGAPADEADARPVQPWCSFERAQDLAGTVVVNNETASMATSVCESTRKWEVERGRC